jgi:hypothetical protein
MFCLLQSRFLLFAQSWLCVRSSCRLSRLVGLPVMVAVGSRKYFLSSATLARFAALSEVSSYMVWAMVAEPRVSSMRKTLTCHTCSACCTSIRSPTLTLCAGLTRCPFCRARPSSMALVARLRVLKNLAAHSHLSIRVVSLMKVVAFIYQLSGPITEQYDPKKYVHSILMQFMAAVSQLQGIFAQCLCIQQSPSLS